jgi:hypothetical protein
MATDLRSLTNDLARGAWSLTALAIAAERGVLSSLAERPRTVDEIARDASIDVATAKALVDVLEANEVVSRQGDSVHDSGSLQPFRDPSAAKVLAADIRSTLGTTRDATYAAETTQRVEGWRAVDPVAVRAQGILSHAMTLSLAPMLRSNADMHARLSSPGARFLDVGAGASGLGIAYATMYPTLRVTGLEPSETACEESRRAIDAAGLGDRVEIRRAFGQDIAEDGAFAAAYVAQMFIPDEAVSTVWAATLRALEPGGWLTTGATGIDGAGLAPSVMRLRSAVWGGGVRTPASVVAALTAAGFTQIMPRPTPGMVPILARRPGA